MPAVAAKFKLFDKGQKRLDSMRKAMAKADGFVKVGVLQESSERADDELSNAEVAFIHEFGAGAAPERSWLRSTFDANRDVYLRLLERMVPLIMDEKLSARKAMDIIGQRFAADCKARITSGIAPALSEETIRAKGSSKPLIDTSQFINSITYAFIENRVKGGGRR
jgi:hypothetical protein